MARDPQGLTAVTIASTLLKSGSGPSILAEDVRGGGIANYTTAERDGLNTQSVDNNMIIYNTTTTQYETYTGGTRQTDGSMSGGTWDQLRTPSTNTITRLTDLDDTRVIETSFPTDWVKDTAGVTTPPYLDRDLEHNLVTRFRIRNTGPTIEVDDVNVEQHSWRDYQITALLTTGFGVYTITDSEYSSSLDSSLVTVSGRGLFDEAANTVNHNAGIWVAGFNPFVYVGENTHAAQNDVLIYDAGLRQWVNSQKLAREVMDRKNADELISAQLNSLYRELEEVTYDYSAATTAGEDSSLQTATLENIFKKVTDQEGELGTNQYIWPAYIERNGGAEEFHIFFNDLTAAEIDTIENHYLTEGLGRIALATNTFGYAGITQTTTYVSTGLSATDGHAGNTTFDSGGVTQVLAVGFDGDITGTANNKLAVGDIFSFVASPGPTQLWLVDSIFFDATQDRTTMTFFGLVDGVPTTVASDAIFGEIIYKQLVADVTGTFNFQIAEFGTQSGSVHFMKLIPDASWNETHATELKALAQFTTAYLGHTSYSFNPSIETKKSGATGGPSGRDGIFSNPRLIVTKHSFGGTSVAVTGEALDAPAPGFVSNISIDGTDNRVFQPKLFILTQGFVLLAETPELDTGTRAGYRDTSGVFGPINTVYHFDSSNDSWYQGDTKIVGF